MKCLIIDDDELSRFHLKTLLDKIAAVEIIGIFESVASAIESESISKTDLIFLDVEMPDINGIEFIKTFTLLPQIIIVSTKKDYAVDGFDHQILDYLVKPVELARLIKATEKYKNALPIKNEGNQDYFFVKKGQQIIKIVSKEIDYVEALGDYVNIFSGKIKHTVLITMKEMDAKLPSADFCRIHKSYIIRIDKVAEYEENSVCINGKILPVSRHYKESFLKKLKLFN
jgi:DNA-binding LytR/AlgR family response regulator